MISPTPTSLKDWGLGSLPFHVPSQNGMFLMSAFHQKVVHIYAHLHVVWQVNSAVLLKFANPGFVSDIFIFLNESLLSLFTSSC